jgi:hypothetical protein
MRERLDLFIRLGVQVEQEVRQWRRLVTKAIVSERMAVGA